MGANHRLVVSLRETSKDEADSHTGAPDKRLRIPVLVWRSRYYLI